VVRQTRQRRISDLLPGSPSSMVGFRGGGSQRSEKKKCDILWLVGEVEEGREAAGHVPLVSASWYLNLHNNSAARLGTPNFISSPRARSSRSQVKVKIWRRRRSQILILSEDRIGDEAWAGDGRGEAVFETHSLPRPAATATRPSNGQTLTPLARA
jgi:hypothetical protein